MISYIVAAAFVLSVLLLFLATLIKRSLDDASKTKIRIIVEKTNNQKYKELTSLQENGILTAKITFEILTFALLTFLIYQTPLSSQLIAMLAVSASIYFGILLIISSLIEIMVHKFSEAIVIRSWPWVMVYTIGLFPLVIISLAIQKAFLAMFKVKIEEQSAEEELMEIVDDALEDGDLDEQEGELIKKVIDFGELEVVDIFTPRVHMVSASVDDTNEHIIDLFKKSGYSRMPVYEKSVDNILGILNHKDFYNHVLLEEGNIRDYIKPAVIVTEYMPLYTLLTMLKNNKAQMAIVKDEYNGTRGLVTMEDILEEIVGDIWDEHDEIVERFEEISPTEWNIKGSATIEDILDRTGVDLDLDDEADHSTLSGWILEKLGRMAHEGESFEINNHQVTILSASEKMVLEVNLKQVMYSQTNEDDEQMEP